MPPLGLAERFVVPPLPAHHSVAPLDDILAIRLVLLTFTVTLELALHPLLSVTVTVYEVVEDMPLAVGLEVVVEVKPVEGDHE